MADVRAITTAGKTHDDLTILRHHERRLANGNKRAVITEAHRIAAVITSRLIRIAPTEVLRFRDVNIPAGVSPPFQSLPSFRTPITACAIPSSLGDNANRHQ